MTILYFFIEYYYFVSFKIYEENNFGLNFVLLIISS